MILHSPICTEAASTASSELHQLSVQHVPGVLKPVCTGRKGDDSVVGQDLQVCPEVGPAAHFLQPVRVLLDASEVLHIGGRIHGGDIAGEKIDPVRCRRRHQVHPRMLVIVALVLVPGDAGEHGAVLHVVPVNDGIVIGKVGPVLDIQERTAVAVLGSVCQVFQVIRVVIALYDRVINRGIRRQKEQARNQSNPAT